MLVMPLATRAVRYVDSATPGSREGDKVGDWLMFDVDGRCFGRAHGEHCLDRFMHPAAVKLDENTYGLPVAANE